MKRTLSFLSLIAMGTIAAGCGTFERSERSGYAYRETGLNVGRDRKIYEEDSAARSLGISRQKGRDDDQQDIIALRAFLTRAEKNLEGRRERDQYFRNKPYMRNDSERLEFLRLGSFDARQRWLESKGIHGTSTSHSPEIQGLIDQNDITLGMTKQAVRDSWGEPENVEVAGNPIYGNERWQYSEQITSSDGYQTERRMVYFESGRVIGWEKN